MTAVLSTVDEETLDRPHRTVEPAERRATFLDAVRSEWTKLRSIRSVRFILLATIVYGIGFGAGISYAFGRDYSTLDAAGKAAFDPTAISLNSYALAQMGVAALGAMLMTIEYATGGIQAALCAVPRRSRVLAAKSTICALVALPVGTAVGFGAFLVGQAVLARQGAPHVTLGSPDSLRAIFGDALYLTVVGLLGVAVGTLVRSTAGAVTLLGAVMLIIPTISRPLPDPVAHLLMKFWPANAGSQLMATRHDPVTALGAWSGFAVLLGFVAVVVGVAFRVFRSRDV
jgi:ABC-2 type transport system permease protein